MRTTSAPPCFLPPTFVPGFHDEDAVRAMPYRRFGDRWVSQLSFGATALAGLYTGGSIADAATAKEVVGMALRAGVNLIDTAPWYGHGALELILGEALEGIPRSAYYLSTKVGRYFPGPLERFDFSYARTISSVSESLARLGVEYIDTVQVHDPEFAPSLDVIINETLPALEALRKEGKIRYIGITGYPLATLRELAARTPVKVDSAISFWCVLLSGLSVVC